eukprot:CAMPEP_0178429652 /NCGR_PEP_ID=MMETSP0689_2-20121128/30912_1 /TAXON_ID=160604 /ORGANISM="Amphidinium massartii, Strain CS-259" /LENGTH=63 /DNA_ID=CAMNT_0020051479 /DNA_START=605 /DNA_END=796 /DNA_ORIENTATION=-
MSISSSASACRVAWESAFFCHSRLRDLATCFPYSVDAEGDVGVLQLVRQESHVTLDAAPSPRH